jgi:hypothetical protein
MKSYFEDSIPFIKPQDVRVMMDGPDLWNAGNKQTFTRQTYTQVLLNTVRHAKELGVKRPKAKDLSFTWTQEFKYPDLLQQIIDDISEDVWDVLEEI